MYAMMMTVDEVVARFSTYRYNMYVCTQLPIIILNHETCLNTYRSMDRIAENVFSVKHQLPNIKKVSWQDSISYIWSCILDYNKNKRMFNLSVENAWMNYFYIKGYPMSLENESDIVNKNNEYVLHRWIENKFVVYITSYTFDGV